MNVESTLVAELSMQFGLPSAEEPIRISTSVQFASQTAKLVSVKEQQELSDRVSWSDIELLIVSGNCVVSFDGQAKPLRPHESLAIPAMVPHTIVALTDVRFVVSFRNGLAESVE